MPSRCLDFARHERDLLWAEPIMLYSAASPARFDPHRPARALAVGGAAAELDRTADRDRSGIARPRAIADTIFDRGAREHAVRLELAVRDARAGRRDAVGDADP